MGICLLRFVLFLVSSLVASHINSGLRTGEGHAGVGELRELSEENLVLMKETLLTGSDFPYTEQPAPQTLSHTAQPSLLILVWRESIPTE